MNQQNALDIIERLFDMPVPRRHKCATLYDLAQRARGGHIVELGTYHGNGTIALTLGARDRRPMRITRSAYEAAIASPDPMLLVHTIDDYAKRQGWAGEPYVPEDEQIFWRNLNAAALTEHVALMRQDIRLTGLEWTLGPIAFLFWDLGVTDRLARDFWAWERHIMKGGTFAIHDTADNRLGASDVVADATSSGRWRFEAIWPGGVWTVIRQ